ncbi:enoyl-CoA hydratase [Salirhabdus salicampi]|uniref:enoyl-CoA hydratase n=1 Tax=Salirhabdus salicampi TaxID=476102 RepID=UPI0020C54154|nr:enoyl-CoA hydratase [Salirhabdus salicampi]MCP8618117.1 enoyl-CoA hydratase [Salirhabdus salicampi]
MTATVLLSNDEHVATITLNRPEQMNAMNLNMIEQLLSKLEEVQQSNANILVITGRGKAFSAGGDIKTMLQDTTDEEFSSVMDKLKQIAIMLHTMPVITVSAVNGAAAGLGFSLAIGTDYVLADTRAKLAMNFIGIGLIPDGGGHFFLERRIGSSKAKQLIWGGEKLTASEAQKMGIVDHINEEGFDFHTFTEQFIVKLRRKPLQAMIETKKIYSDSSQSQLLYVLERETIGQQSMRTTKDHLEGIHAFLEKRQPRFNETS